MRDAIDIHHFKTEIINYWHGFSKKELVDLLTVYDIKEAQENDFQFSNEFYEQFYEICLESYQKEHLSEEYVEAIVNLCAKLPTTLMMYFMQNVHKKNSNLFQLVYQKLSSDSDYHELYKRCMSFEKNLLLTRVCSESRLLIIDTVLTRLMEENHAG
ncbi:hypothetical protein [Fastidiosibacter lacustris]|uniref:type IVB secretion system protein IcmW n=1 Tax=Fastidiosibacter lacustris TaxID=2056695 RepID=UPI000E34B42A|nr:hypothetical protein [Fastidiosibacter lacustris]